MSSDTKAQFAVGRPGVSLMLQKTGNLQEEDFRLLNQTLRLV